MQIKQWMPGGLSCPQLAMMALRAIQKMDKGTVEVMVDTSMPREFSSDCIIAIRFEWDKQALLEAYLQTIGLETSGIYRMP